MHQTEAEEHKPVSGIIQLVRMQKGILSGKRHNAKRHNANRHNANRHNVNRHNANRHNAKRHNAIRHNAKSHNANSQHEFSSNIELRHSEWKKNASPSRAPSSQSTDQNIRRVLLFKFRACAVPSYEH